MKTSVETSLETFDARLSEMSTIARDFTRILRMASSDYKESESFFRPVDGKVLEEMAQQARRHSLGHFGKTVVLYAPIYVANHCTNRCTYCSYHLDETSTKRRVLSLEEVDAEGAALHRRGIRHIVLLTGDDPKRSSVSYIGECVKMLRKYFDSIVIEVYALTEAEYAHLVACGISGVTLYQETYDEQAYATCHLSGPKADFAYRLDAVERAIRAGARQINIGVLLGLSDTVKDVTMLSLHLDYLYKKYPDVDYSVSLPRLKPIDDMPFRPFEVTQTDYVRFLCGLRIKHPNVSQNVSTRESAEFRRHLLPIGVNKMSAGVSTEVGGYAAQEKGSKQFAITDESSVEEVKEMIRSCGYEPVMKDWIL